MKTQDLQQMGDLYEEGIWDRAKASISGVKSGVKGLLGGQGYAKSAQAGKLGSLLSGKMNAILADIQKFENDIRSYTKDPNSATVGQKVAQLKQIVQRNLK